MTRIIEVDPENVYEVNIEPVMGSSVYEMDYKIRICKVALGQPISYLGEVDIDTVLRAYFEHAEIIRTIN